MRPPDVEALLERHRLVPVVVIDDPAHAEPLGEALVSAGLPLVEVTLRTAAGVEAIRVLAARGDLTVGAGTVLTSEQVDRAVDAGAAFVVSPGLSRSVVERCADSGVVAVPGVATATEIQAALELRVSLLKFFPAGSSGGAAALAALSAPFGKVRFVPTGGIGPDDLQAYLRLPAVIAVGGSWMVPRASIRGGDFGEVRRRTAAAVALVRSSRGE